jgi:hypothetical protein
MSGYVFDKGSSKNSSNVLDRADNQEKHEQHFIPYALRMHPKPDEEKKWGV